MINLTLTQCFGVNASQDSTVITIQKSDLPGLTPTTNNTSEELVVGILLKILENFEGKITTEANDTITTENGLKITYVQGDIASGFYLFFWRVLFSKKKGINYKVCQFVFQDFELYE